MTHPAPAHVDDDQYERWKREADKRQMSMSEFIRSMTEAGLKKFQRDVNPDESKADLRRDRNDLLSKLKEAHEQISKLEEEKLQGERNIIIDYIETNPGCSYQDIQQKLAETAPHRTTEVLSEIEGEEVERDGTDEWYPR